MTDGDSCLEQARRLVGRDPMARHLGFEVVDLDETRAVTRYVPRAEHLTALDRVQGGAVFAQADHAIALAASALGGTVVTIEVKINFLASAGRGDVLLAEARSVDVKRKRSLWQAEIRKEADGELTAVCQGLAYHRREGSYEETDTCPEQ